MSACSGPPKPDFLSNVIRLLALASLVGLLWPVGPILAHTSDAPIVFGRYAPEWFAFIVLYGLLVVTWLGLTTWMLVRPVEEVLGTLLPRAWQGAVLGGLAAVGLAVYWMLADSYSLGHILGLRLALSGLVLTLWVMVTAAGSVAFLVALLGALLGDLSLGAFAWVCPLLLSLLLFLPSNGRVRVLADGWKYMSNALSLVQGRGFTDFAGIPYTARPAFPLWLALFFKCFGASVPSTFVFTRIFYVLNPIVLYFLGARLYNRWVGLGASFLVLTSYSLSKWSTLVHLDYILPGIILLYLLSLLWAYEGESSWRFVLSGVLLGVAYLFKEMALLFLPLPFLLVVGIKEFRTKRGAVGAGLALMAFLVTVAPWWAYVRHVTSASATDPLVGNAGTFAFRALIDAVEDQRNIPQAFVTYYSDILAPNFGLAPLFVLAWLATLILALCGRQAEQSLLLAALCFLPLILFQGLEGFRPRQGVIFNFLSYLALAGMLWRVAQLVQKQWHLRANTSQYLAATLGVALVFGQLWVEGSWWSYAKDYNVVGFLGHGWDDVPLSDGGPPSQSAARWLLQHAEPGEAILSDHRAFMASVNFLTQGRFQLHEMPLLCSSYYGGAGGLLPASRCGVHSNSDKQTIIFLWRAGTGSQLSNRALLMAVSEEDLLTTIESQEIHYVIVPNLRRFEALYFEQSPHFTQVPERDKAPWIYRVEKIAPVAFEMHVEREIQGDLNTLQWQNPLQYRQITEEFLKAELGLSEEEIAKIQSGEYPPVLP